MRHVRPVAYLSIALGVSALGAWWHTTPSTRRGPPGDNPPTALTSSDKAGNAKRVRLSGSVTSSAGLLLRGATVRAEYNSGSVATQTDDSGRFVLDAVSSGHYRISARKAGFVTAVFPHGRTYDPTSHWTVPAGGSAALDLVLSPSSAIAGHVTDEAGDPVVGAQVRLWRPEEIVDEPPIRLLDGQAAHSQQTIAAQEPTRTDDRGYYRIHSIPAGEYFVSAGLPDSSQEPDVTSETVIIDTYYPATGCPQCATRIAVDTAGEATADIVLRRTRLAELNVSVSGSSGAVVAAPRVRVSRMNVNRSVTPERLYGGGPSPQSATSRLLLRPGQPIVISASSGAPWARPGVQQSVEFGVLTLPGLAEGTQQRALNLSPGCSVFGKIVLQGRHGSAAPPLMSAVRVYPVGLSSPGMPLGSAPVKDDGTFELINVFGTSLIVTDASAASGVQVLSTLYKGTDISDRGIDCASGQKMGPVIVTLTDAVSQVAGKIRGYRPWHDTVIVVFASDESKWQLPSGRYVRVVWPSSDGSYTVSGLAPGSYRVVSIVRDVIDRADGAEVLRQLQGVATAITVGSGSLRVSDIVTVRP